MENKNEVIIEYNVPARMRDGAVLMADIYRPHAEGKFPVLLQRTPYSKAFVPFVFQTMDPIKAARAGYVVVVQDVRGRWESEGNNFYPYQADAEDGYDTVEWAASLPYSNGRVGLFGYSYYAATQWLAASTRPPHLKAFFPFSCRYGGFLLLSGRGSGVVSRCWMDLTVPGAERRRIIKAKAGSPEMFTEMFSLLNSIDRIEDVFRTLPLRDIPAMKLGNGFAPNFYHTLDYGPGDEHYRDRSLIDKHDRIEVPALIFSGWYDIMLDTDLKHFNCMRAQAGSKVAKENTRLVIGPWTHLILIDSVGQLNFGLSASALMLERKTDLMSVHMQWFDNWLKGIKNNVNDEPPVKLFVMGDNVWRGENEWPLARTQYTPLYIHKFRKSEFSLR